MVAMEVNAKSSKKRQHDNAIPDSPKKRQRRTHTYSRSISSIGGKYSASYQGIHLVQIANGNPEKKPPVSRTFGVQFDDNTQNRRNKYISGSQMLRAAVKAELLADGESDSTSEDTVDNEAGFREHQSAESGSSPSHPSHIDSPRCEIRGKGGRRGLEWLQSRGSCGKHQPRRLRHVQYTATDNQSPVGCWLAVRVSAC
jgi:hypothetical protein